MLTHSYLLSLFAFATNYGAYYKFMLGYK